jgi:hypothetical protein
MPSISEVKRWGSTHTRWAAGLASAATARASDSYRDPLPASCPEGDDDIGARRTEASHDGRSAGRRPAYLGVQVELVSRQERLEGAGDRLK